MVDENFDEIRGPLGDENSEEIYIFTPPTAQPAWREGDLVKPNFRDPFRTAAHPPGRILRVEDGAAWIRWANLAQVRLPTAVLLMWKGIV